MPMYLIDGMYIRGFPVTKAEAPKEVRDIVEHSAQMMKCTADEFLVLKDAVSLEFGVATEMGFMIVPLSKLSGICVPPYDSSPLSDYLQRKGVKIQD